MTAKDPPAGLRWFFRAVLGYTVVAVALFFGATWRAEAVFDSKQGIGDLATFNVWTAVAGRAIWSAAIVWVLGLLAAVYANLRGRHRPTQWIQRPGRFALAVPLGLFVAGIAVSVALWW